MIYESAPWKRDLLRDAELIDRWRKKPSSTRRSTLLEKRIFVSAFAVRKLIEARRLSTSFAGRSVEARFLPARGRAANRLNNHHFDRQYRLDSGEHKNLSAARLIDLIIHSFTFVECVNETDEFEGFLITSDQTRKLGLYEISADRYLDLLRAAGTDDPEMTTYKFNEARDDYDVWRGPEPKRVR